MKRNILYVSLAAAMAATNLTGCIDTDEPEGILALREAKASYINAQAANETTLANASAALTTAQAATENARAKQQEALAKQSEYEAALVEYEVKMAELTYQKQQSLDAIEIAQAQADAQTKLQEAANELAKAKAEAEQAAQEAETALLKLKAQYNQSLADLETSSVAYENAVKANQSKQTFLDTKTGQYLTIASIKSKYDDAKAAYRTATTSVITYTEALTEALKTNTTDAYSASRDSLNEIVSLNKALNNAELALVEEEKVLEVLNNSLEDAKASNFTSEADYQAKGGEYQLQLVEIETKIAENEVAQAEFAVKPEKEKVELQGQIDALDAQIDELDEQLKTALDAEGNTIYPYNETLNAIQANINEANDRVNEISDDYQAKVDSINEEYAYWKGIILTWKDITVSNYSEIEGVIFDAIGWNSFLIKVDEDNSVLTISDANKSKYTNKFIATTSGGYDQLTTFTDSESNKISYTMWMPYDNEDVFFTLRTTIDNAVKAYKDAGAPATDSKAYKALVSLQSSINGIYADAEKVTEAKDDAIAALTLDFNTNKANELNELTLKTIPALNDKLEAAKEPINDKITALENQKLDLEREKSAIETTDATLEKEYALLNAEKTALEIVISAYTGTVNGVIEDIEDNITAQEYAIAEAKKDIEAAELDIEEFYDLADYNEALRAFSVAKATNKLDDATEDLEEAEELLKHYEALLQTSIDSLTSTEE